jgi:hypothetical protein
MRASARTSAVARGLQGGHPSCARILKPCKITVKGAPAARRWRDPSDPGPMSLDRDSGGAYRMDGEVRHGAEVCSWLL